MEAARVRRVPPSPPNLPPAMQAGLPDKAKALVPQPAAHTPTPTWPTLPSSRQPTVLKPARHYHPGTLHLFPHSPLLPLTHTHLLCPALQ